MGVAECVAARAPSFQSVHQGSVERQSGRRESWWGHCPAALRIPMQRACHFPRAIEQAKWFCQTDRKSTRLNSSHGYISYAVFCLKKKKPVQQPPKPHRNDEHAHQTEKREEHHCA